MTTDVRLVQKRSEITSKVEECAEEMKDAVIVKTTRSAVALGEGDGEGDKQDGALKREINKCQHEVEGSVATETTSGKVRR